MGSACSRTTNIISDREDVDAPCNHPFSVQKQQLDPAQHLLITDSKQKFRHGNELFRANFVFKAMEAYLEALFLLKRYQDWPEKVTQEISFQSNLGAIYFAEGLYLGAKEVISKVEKAIDSKGIDSNQPHLLSLAVLVKHGIMDDKDELIFILNEHILIDAIAADVLNNLGACCEVCEKLQDAHSLYAESLRLRQVVFGEHSLKTAEALQNLATVLDAQGHSTEALNYLSSALDIEYKIRGRDSAENTATMNNLAILLAHLGDIPRAQDLLTRCVALRQSALGHKHSLTIASAKNLEQVMTRSRAATPEAITVYDKDTWSPLREVND